MRDNSAGQFTRLGKSLACLAVAAASVIQVDAALLYGTVGTGGTPSTLVQIDPVTGTSTVIGPVGYAVNGLTYDSTTGTLYGSARSGGGLLTINTTTGAGTLVGSGFGLNNVLLASNSAGDLFGWYDPSADDLTSINKVTGVATVVGESGLGTATHGLAFDNSDNLYMHNYTGSFYSMNTTTGAASHLGYTGYTAHHGDFNPDNNYYYGLDLGGDMRVLDLVGGGTYIGTVSTGLSGLHTLAFVSSVPEAGTTALMLGLSFAGLAAARRRSKS